MHIRQPEVTTLKFESQSLMIQPQQMQHRRMDIVNMRRILHCVEPKVIRLP